MSHAKLFSRILTIAFNNPVFLIRYLFGTICAAIYNNIIKEPKYKKVEGKIDFEFDFSLDINIKKMYCGIYEYETVQFLKSKIHQGDTFIDVGANIGFLSAIGAACVGPEGEVHSFEPVPDYFTRLKKMADENPHYSINVNNFACGDVEGSSIIDLPNDGNIGWNTLVPSFIVDKKKSYTIEIKRLDSYILGKKLSKISVIKIDVEGFEFPVLKGLQNLFDNNVFPILLVEIAPGAYPLLGFSLEQLAKYMEHYHYSCELLSNQGISFDIRTLSETTNVVFFCENEFSN